MTEEQAREAGIEVDVGKLQLGAVGKPHAINEPLGLVKSIVAKDDGRILGIHMVGAEACELIAEAVLAIEAGVTFSQLEHVIHPHPTLSEALKEAVLAARGEAVHMLAKR
jgi:dihydrolipoamide dehydrogenase